MKLLVTIKSNYAWLADPVHRARRSGVQTGLRLPSLLMVIFGKDICSNVSVCVAVCCTLIIHNKLNNCSKFAVIGHSIASFPGSPALECKHDNQEEPGIFSHVLKVEQW